MRLKPSLRSMYLGYYTKQEITQMFCAGLYPLLGLVFDYGEQLVKLGGGATEASPRIPLLPQLSSNQGENGVCSYSL